MSKFKELMKKRGFVIALIVLAIAVVGTLGTYAIFYWRSQDNTEINLTIGNYADVVFPLGQELNTNNLTPVYNYTDGEVLTFSIKNNNSSTSVIKYTVNFDLTNIDTELANTSLKYTLVSGNTVLASGDFNGATAPSTIHLVTNTLPTGTTNFSFYLYIDGNIENNPNMMNKNIAGTIVVTAEELVPFNLAQHITNLYTNATKTEVTNNSITYNYATSVDLMNDRLGGTTQSLDGGNIRYYGVEGREDNVLEAESDGFDYAGNWEVINGAPFSDSEGCYNYFSCSVMYSNFGFSSVEDCNNGIDSLISSAFGSNGINSLDELCGYSDTPRYYRYKVKNYIDIGDKTTVAVPVNNWDIAYEKMGYSSPGFNDSNECLSTFTEQGVTDQVVNQAFGSYGFTTLQELCSTSNIPAGTSILWRIIGIFDGKVRVIRDNAIGTYSWDTSSSNVNDGYGINEWSQADLMKLLNPGYNNNSDSICTYNRNTSSYDCESELVNNSLYWNSDSGNCYVASNDAYEECDFSSSGLSSFPKSIIVDQTIYLGSLDIGTDGPSTIFSDDAYVGERGNGVYNINNYSSSDGITRTTSWTGKVALPYPSDFGYAADFRNCSPNLRQYSSCADYSWLSEGSRYTNTPELQSARSVWLYKDYLKFTETSAGHFTDENFFPLQGWCDTVYDVGVYPVLTLNSNVATLGTGTKDDPYVVVGSNYIPGELKYKPTTGYSFCS